MEKSHHWRKMPVAPITYFYLILLIADTLSLIWAIIKRDWEMVQILVPLFPIFLIGFSSNYQICPMFFCIGTQ